LQAGRSYLVWRSLCRLGRVSEWNATLLAWSQLSAPIFAQGSTVASPSRERHGRRRAFHIRRWCAPYNSPDPTCCVTRVSLCAGIELLRGLLTLNPAHRLTAAQALDHRWFRESPPPTDQVGTAQNMKGFESDARFCLFLQRLMPSVANPGSIGIQHHA
jgi:serine/threonine protein kinase